MIDIWMNDVEGSKTALGQVHVRAWCGESGFKFRLGYGRTRSRLLSRSGCAQAQRPHTLSPLLASFPSIVTSQALANESEYTAFFISISFR